MSNPHDDAVELQSQPEAAPDALPFPLRGEAGMAGFVGLVLWNETRKMFGLAPTNNPEGL